MTQITDTQNATAAGYVPPQSAVSASSSGPSFADTIAQVTPDDPPSAYIPRPGPYSVETCGSHIVNGVQLIPGAPGYRPELAAPYLQEIAATQERLAAMYASASAQPSPATQPAPEASSAKETSTQEAAPTKSDPDVAASDSDTSVTSSPAIVAATSKTQEILNTIKNTLLDERVATQSNVSDSLQVDTSVPAPKPADSPIAPLVTAASYFGQRVDMEAATMLMDVSEDDSNSSK